MSSDDIKFACPHCQQHLEAPPEMAGETVECPNCRYPIKVPLPPATVPADADVASPVSSSGAGVDAQRTSLDRLYKMASEQLAAMNLTPSALEHRIQQETRRNASQREALGQSLSDAIPAYESVLSAAENLSEPNEVYFLTGLRVCVLHRDTPSNGFSIVRQIQWCDVLNSSETATEVVDSADATKRRTQNQLVGGILTYGAVTAGSHLASLLPSVLGNGVRYGLASFLGQKQGESMAKTAAATQFTVMTTNVDYCGSDGATMREVVVVSEDDRDFIDSLQACVHAWRNGTLPEPVVLLLVAAKTSSLAPTPVEYNQLPDSQSAQQSNTHSQIPTTVGQNSKPQPSFSGIASRGEPDVAPANRVQQVSEGVVNVTGDYQSVYNALRQAMMDAGGTIKTDAMNTGIVEGAWKYGINAFGLRVTARFNTLPSGQIQVSIKGGFKDALDTFGTGRKKAIEITTAFLQKFPSSSASLSQQSSMPPPMPQYAQRMAAPSAPSGSTPYQGKTKMLAGILGLLLGGLGVHKFYLGSYGWGILYILSCWTFIPAIVGGVEGIIFLCMAQEHFDLRYNYTPPHPFKW